MKTFKHILSSRYITGLLCLSLAILFTTSNALSLRAQTLNPSPQHRQLSALRTRVQQIYTSQIGVREKHPNSGTEVEQYLRYVNLTKGNPWCAAFVCWVYGQAGLANPRTGWSPRMFPGTRTIFERGKILRIENGKWNPVRTGENDWAERNTTITESGKVQVLNTLPTFNFQFSTFNSPGTGDVFGLFFPEKHRIAHVGFIDSWDGTWMITVEGNTNPAGSREGDGVYRKRRLVKTVYKVARYIN